MHLSLFGSHVLEPLVRKIGRLAAHDDTHEHFLRCFCVFLIEWDLIASLELDVAKPSEQSDSGVPHGRNCCWMASEI